MVNEERLARTSGPLALVDDEAFSRARAREIASCSIIHVSLPLTTLLEQQQHFPLSSIVCEGTPLPLSPPSYLLYFSVNLTRYCFSSVLMSPTSTTPAFFATTTYAPKLVIG